MLFVMVFLRKKVWRKYREEKEKKEGKRIIDLVFRDKSIGWLSNQYKITYDDGSVELEKSSEHPFHAGYLKGLFYRPSCGCCNCYYHRQNNVAIHQSP